MNGILNAKIKLLPGSWHRLKSFGGAAFALACAASIVVGVVVPARIAIAEETPVVTLELEIVHGRLSTPREKREVSKARLEVPLDGKERGIWLRFSNPYMTTSSAGQQTQFIDNATPSFTIMARPLPGGFEARVEASYLVPVSVPEAYVLEGVSPKTAIRGFDVGTRIALPTKEGAIVEIGSIEDPVTDRAWSASLTVLGVKGTVSSGALPKNTVFTAKTEESDGKTAKTTTLRVASSDVARESRVSDRFRVPYPSAGSYGTGSYGTQVQFIDLQVSLNVVADPKNPGLTKAQLSVARQRGSKEPWSRFETPHEITLADGGRADLGIISEGGRTIRATLEKAAE